MSNGFLQVYPRFISWKQNASSVWVRNDSGTINTYITNTTTNKTTYSDVAKTTAHANPIVLNSTGEANIFLNTDGLYTFLIKDSAGVTVATINDLGSDDTTSATAVTESGANLVPNGSFEDDADADGVPDNWTIVTQGATAISTTDSAHGIQGIKFTSTGSGGGNATTGFINIGTAHNVLLEFWIKSSVVDVLNIVKIHYYDKAQALISSETLYTDSTTNPTSWTFKEYLGTTPALTAQCKIQIIGCDPSDATTGNVIFDGVALYAHNFVRRNQSGDTLDAISIDDTTDTTSGITGSIHTDGGLGVAKALYVATTSRLVGAVTADAIVSVDDVTDTTSTVTGSIHTDGGLGIAKALWVGTTSRLVGAVTADSTLASGTHTVTGGITATTTIAATGIITGAAGSGIGIAPTEGTLHVHTATAGGVTASTSADELVVENSSDGGINILVPNANFGGIRFGSPANNSGLILDWNYNASQCRLLTNDAGGFITLSTGSAVEAMRINSSRLTGFGTTVPLGKVHVSTGDAGAVTPGATRDELVVEGPGHTGISIMSPDTYQTGIEFKTPSRSGGDIYYNYTDNYMSMEANPVSSYIQFWTSSGVVVDSPTGGAKGDGTINAVAVYDDNVLLTCYVFDQVVEKNIDLIKWDALVPNRFHKNRDTEEITEEIRAHEYARKFQARLGTQYDPLNIDQYAQHWKDKKHLTSMPNEQSYDPVNNKLDIGNWVQRLLETVEIQAVHIDTLNQRLKALENA